MNQAPDTSTSLLRDLAHDTGSARWAEFVERYRPMMAAYMREAFPYVDAEEIIQETFIALIRIFPVYRYVPEEKGAFHNYLTGVLRHKALKAVAAENRRKDVLSDYKAESSIAAAAVEDSAMQTWRASVFEIALQQFLADDTVQERTKQIFIRVGMNGEKASEVASSFGIAENAVYQIKARSTAKIKELVNLLEKACDEAVGHD
jgi:RNA polymerase sigma factor (sigma-70 family)